MFLSHFFLLLSATIVSCSPVESQRSEYDKRQSTNTSSLTVDLGYNVYQGYYNSTSQLNIFKGYVTHLRLTQSTFEVAILQSQNSICSASSGTAALAKATISSSEQDFDNTGYGISSSLPTESQRSFVSICQILLKSQFTNSLRPANYNFTRSGLGDEDCLFLSVWASPNATNLPVMVWIRMPLFTYLYLTFPAAKVNLFQMAEVTALVLATMISRN